MRWFWLFILGLVVLTGGLYTSRVRTKAVIVPEPVPASTRTPEIASGVPHGTAEQVEQPESKPESVVQAVVKEPIAVLAEAIVVEPVEEPVEKLVVEQIDEPIAEIVSEPIPEPVEVEVAVPELIVEDEIVLDVLPTIEELVVESEPAPTYEQLADGSFKIHATNTHIKGSGTIDDPFVLDWVTLRSIEQGYNPKKNMNDLPDWLDLLDGQHVSIIGNTLVPVIATTTQELLVMQNPWDGCCIGIPPSPYDAIEVTLNHDVDFGSSAVGYGTVQGVFILDPYVVDGWVLGLFLIEEATYRSGDGIAFPDF